jgi:hypothetical protein
MRLVSRSEGSLQEHDTPRSDFVERPPRFLLIEPAHLEVDGQAIAVQLVDISPGGVKLFTLTGGLLGLVGRSGRLRMLGMRAPVSGAIRWCTEGKMGFRFDTELTAQVVECIRTNPSVQVRRAFLDGRLNSI